jgi:hypothetical protein
VRTQGVCGGCVSFTTIACAEAAVAAGLKASTLNVLDFSEQVRWASVAACIRMLLCVRETWLAGVTPF